MSYADRFPKRQAIRDQRYQSAIKTAIDPGRPLSQQLSPRQIQDRVQWNEANIDAGAGYSTPALVVPVVRGDQVELASAAKVTLDRQAPAMHVAVEDEYVRLKRRLANETKEEVTNYGDEVYIGILNCVRYFVPARESKMLPATLAQHFRMKNSYRQIQAVAEKRMGQLPRFTNDTENDNILDARVVANEVRYFAAGLYGVDQGQRTHAVGFTGARGPMGFDF